MESEEARSAPRAVRLDHRQVRVMAHPLRLRLVGALRVKGPATATRLAELLGTNTGATSYHLRQLAEVGLVVEDPDLGTGRQRYWRAAHDVTSWEPSDFDDDPDARAAIDRLVAGAEFAGGLLDEVEMPVDLEAVADAHCLDYTPLDDALAAGVT